MDSVAYRMMDLYCQWQQNAVVFRLVFSDGKTGSEVIGKIRNVEVKAVEVNPGNC
jgi:hypothetical protein